MNNENWRNGNFYRNFGLYGLEDYAIAELFRLYRLEQMALSEVKGTRRYKESRTSPRDSKVSPGSSYLHRFSISVM